MSFDYEKANEMLTRAKAGDQQAFAYLYEAYYTYAYTGTEKLGTIEDREDATQEAFVKCFAKLQSGEDITNFGTYIKHTSQNVATDMIKAREAGKRINADSNIVSNDDGEEIDIYDEIDSEEQVLYAVNEFYKNPETLYEKEEVKALLDEILGVLTTEQRESLIMQYMEGYKQTEIADVYGVSVNTVKSYVNQGKAKVKKKVTEIENRRGIKIQGSLLAFFFVLLHANIEAEAASLPVSGAAFVSANMAASTSSKGILGAIKAFFSKSVSVAGKTISTKAIAITTAGVVGVGAVTGVALHEQQSKNGFAEMLTRFMNAEEYEQACDLAADYKEVLFYGDADLDWGDDVFLENEDDFPLVHITYKKPVRDNASANSDKASVHYYNLDYGDGMIYAFESDAWMVIASDYALKFDPSSALIYETHNDSWCYCVSTDELDMIYYDSYELFGSPEVVEEEKDEEEEEVSYDAEALDDETDDADYEELAEEDDEESLPEEEFAGTQWGQTEGPRFMLRFDTEESGFIGAGDASGTFTKNADGTYNAHMGYDHLLGMPGYTDWHEDYTFELTKNADGTLSLIWNNEVYERYLVREY